MACGWFSASFSCRLRWRWAAIAISRRLWQRWNCARSCFPTHAHAYSVQQSFAVAHIHTAPHQHVRRHGRVMPPSDPRLAPSSKYPPQGDPARSSFANHKKNPLSQAMRRFSVGNGFDSLAGHRRRGCCGRVEAGLAGGSPALWQRGLLREERLVVLFWLSRHSRDGQQNRLARAKVQPGCHQPREGLADSFRYRTNISKTATPAAAAAAFSRASTPGPIYSVRGNPLQMSPSNSGCTFGVKHSHRRSPQPSPSLPLAAPPSRRGAHTLYLTFYSICPSHRPLFPPSPLAPVRALLLTQPRVLRLPDCVATWFSQLAHLQTVRQTTSESHPPARPDRQPVVRLRFPLS